MSEAPPKIFFYKGLRHKFLDKCQLFFEKRSRKYIKHRGE
jgi:hypothetical protein